MFNQSRQNKQDRQGARSVSDLEYRYKFGQTFSELMGVANDARMLAEEAQGDYDELSQEAIFNLLTNNGEWQGLYTEEGSIYINATYIKAGKLAADYIDISGLLKDPSFIIGGFKVSETELSAQTLNIEGSISTSEGTSLKPGEIKAESTLVDGENVVTMRTKLTAGGIVKEFEDTRDMPDTTLMNVILNGEHYNVYLNVDVTPPKIEVIKVEGA